MSVCFDIYHHNRIVTISYPSVLYQFRCLALRHNTVILTSVSLELVNLQLSHCAPQRHESLRQTFSIITLILLDSLLLINKETCRQQLFTCLDSQKKRLIKTVLLSTQKKYKYFFFKIRKLASPNDISNH